VEAGRSLSRYPAELNNIEQVAYGLEGPIGASFQCYFDYTVYLGVTFPTLFAGALEQPVERSHAGEPSCEEELLTRIQQAVILLQARGEPITQAAVGKLVRLRIGSDRQDKAGNAFKDATSLNGYRSFVRIGGIKVLSASHGGTPLHTVLMPLMTSELLYEETLPRLMTSDALSVNHPGDELRYNAV
jgi:hypothetical protein